MDDYMDANSDPTAASKTRKQLGKPATQDWVHQLTIMQQSVLLSAIRGPDGIAKFHACKRLLKWYRRCVLLSAFDGRALQTPWEPGGGSFTGPSCPPPEKRTHSWQVCMEEVADDYIRSQDELPHHFQAHFMHAAQILGYKHPNGEIRDWWLKVYVRIVHTLHLFPEMEKEMDQRLGDNEGQWKDRSDPAACCSD